MLGIKSRSHIWAAMAAVGFLSGCITYQPPAELDMAQAYPAEASLCSDAAGAETACHPGNGLVIYPPPALRNVLPGYYYIPGLEVYPPLVIGGNP